MSETDEKQEESGLRLHVLFLVLDPHALIYSTIILMTAYALYDEGTDLLLDGAWLSLIGIGLAPVFALAMAHAFSDALDYQIRNRRRLSRRDRRKILLHNLQYMYAAVPAMAILAVFTLLDWEADQAVDWLLNLGLASLFFWGVFAARKAKLSWVRQITFGLSYGFMGFIVIVVELVLTHPASS